MTYSIAYYTQPKFQLMFGGSRRVVCIPHSVFGFSGWSAATPDPTPPAPRPTQGGGCHPTVIALAIALASLWTVEEALVRVDVTPRCRSRSGCELR